MSHSGEPGNESQSKEPNDIMSGNDEMMPEPDTLPTNLESANEIEKESEREQSCDESNYVICMEESKKPSFTSAEKALSTEKPTSLSDAENVNLTIFLAFYDNNQTQCLAHWDISQAVDTSQQLSGTPSPTD